MAELLPVGASWLGTQQLMDEQGGKVSTIPAPGDLSNVDQEIYQLKVSTAVNLGFPIATLAASLSHVVLVFGVTRYKDVIGTDNHTYRYGVALRTVILVSAADLNFQLTLPVVAAKVQLSAAEASARLLVQGYKGPLGTELPSWQDFDVESYGQFIKKVSDMQEKILDDNANIVPELLATSAAPAEQSTSTATSTEEPPSSASAVGVVYALREIARGKSLGQALEAFGDSNREARSVIEAVYVRRVGGDAGTQPGAEAKKAADAELLEGHKGIFDMIIHR